MYRKQIALSIELMKFERYMATEHVIKPTEVKKRFHKLIKKAIKLENNAKPENQRSNIT